MVRTKQDTNTRVEELNFLISIMKDLSHNYKGHNISLLIELISVLSYRKEKEEHTSAEKSKSSNHNHHHTNH